MTPSVVPTRRGVLVYLAIAYGLAWAAQIGLALGLGGVPGGLGGLLARGGVLRSSIGEQGPVG